LKIGVLGATGFIGSHILNILSEEDFSCVGFSRTYSGSINGCDVNLCSFDSDNFQWLDHDFDVVVDCADPPHIPNTFFTGRGFDEFHISNKRKLITSASQYGVKHYIYMSSAKIFGECSHDLSFNENSPPNPRSSYASMKFAIENVLQKESETQPIVLSIVRIPYVYGKNGGASLLSLLNIVNSGLWLPLKGVSNQRSFLAVSNLPSFLLALINHNDDKSGVWCLSSDESFSTSKLISIMSNCSGSKVVLFSVPKIVMRLFLFFIGKNDLYFKLYENFVVDDSISRYKLGWSPLSSDSQLLLKFIKDNQ